MPAPYNYIYSKLVANKSDLIGRLAYSIYKQHKIEIRSLKKPLWRSVFENILAAAITSILAALITVVVLINWVGADKLWDMVVEKTTTIAHHQDKAPEIKP